MKATACIVVIPWLTLAATNAPAARPGSAAAATNPPPAAVARPGPAMSRAAAIAALRLSGARVEVDEAQSVQSVSAVAAKIGDADLAALAVLTELESLEIAGGPVTDAWSGPPPRLDRFEAAVSARLCGSPTPGWSISRD